MKHRVLLLSLFAAAAVGALGRFAQPARAHDAPSGGIPRCTYFLGGGGGYKEFTGSLWAPANSATLFYARIVPAWPFGWSGTATVNWVEHPPVLVPVGSSHWFPSATIINVGLGHSFGFRVGVSPNPGVFNYFRLDIHSWHCTAPSSGGGGGGGGGSCPCVLGTPSGFASLAPATAGRDYGA